MSRDEVLDFFQRHRAAFDSQDGDAVVDRWLAPCAMASSDATGARDSVTWWQDDAPMPNNMRMLCIRGAAH